MSKNSVAAFMMIVMLVVISAFAFNARARPPTEMPVGYGEEYREAAQLGSAWTSWTPSMLLAPVPPRPSGFVAVVTSSTAGGPYDSIQMTWTAPTYALPVETVLRIQKRGTDGAWTEVPLIRVAAGTNTYTYRGGIGEYRAMAAHCTVGHVFDSLPSVP